MRLKKHEVLHQRISTEDVYHIYQSIPQGQRGWVIGRLIRAWYQAGQKGFLPSTKAIYRKKAPKLCQTGCLVQYS